MRMSKILAALIFAAASAVPHAAFAASVFYGEVVHVSTTNVKVYDPKNHQTLGFVVTPSFDKVFSADGKTTYQMKNLTHGHYVAVIYDQEALGMRHADKIYLMSNGNQRLGTAITGH